MKKDDVKVGGTYLAKVGRHSAEVRIEGENARGGWNAVSVATGKPVRIKGPKHLRPAKAEQGAKGAGEAAGGAGPDLVPLTQIDREKKRAGRPKAKAPAPAATPARDKAPKAMSCLDAAAAVLRAEGKPMQCKAMVEAMRDKGLWTTTAPTPAATLYSAILRELKKGNASRFRKTDRGHFALSSVGEG